MRFFISLLTLVLVAYHVRIRQMPSVRRVAAYVVAVGAISAFWAGFYIAACEDALGRYGRVVAGTVSEKVSTTGEQGTPTIGGKYASVIVTSEESQFYDIVARLVATGSADAWAIGYSYPCDSARPCSQRSFVSHQRWLQIRPGDRVNVRYVKGTIGGARLDDEPRWATAIARMAIGIALLAAAVLIGDAQRDTAGTRRLQPDPTYPDPAVQA